jgi:transposase
VRNLGVDDWAWRKGQEYGTILVNLDLHRVLDLLPDRASESFSEWLKSHPEVATIARDRCGLYAEGASLGAPQCQQVADRFHLILNLSSTMERVLEERSRQLILPPLEHSPNDTETADNHDPNIVPSPAKPSLTNAELRRERRLERYEQVVALFKAGESQVAISQALGIGRKTVRRWLRRGEFPERKTPHRRPAKVNAFAAHLEQRWNEGCHNATTLYHEIREKGYTGKRSMVARFVGSWRRTGKPTKPKTREKISPKHAAILVTRAADQITEEQQRLLDRISAHCPDIVELRQMALAFRAALTAGESGKLRRWIEGTRRCGFGALVRFAYGLKKDLDAVCAAVETSWSTGQVEGQINRLKMIKRQMYGRAGFDLLRARVLPFSPATSSVRAP